MNLGTHRRSVLYDALSKIVSRGFLKNVEASEKCCVQPGSLVTLWLQPLKGVRGLFSRISPSFASNRGEYGDSGARAGGRQAAFPKCAPPSPSVITDKCTMAFKKWREKGESCRVHRYRCIEGRCLHQVMSAKTKVTKTKTALKQETYNLSDLKVLKGLSET
jgi:hypothetical protein